MINNIPLSPRLDLLWHQSYLEEGYSASDIPVHSSQSSIAIYPRSFVNRVTSFGFDKMRDFNFRGALYIDEPTRISRIWVLEFARKYFGENSFFQITDKQAQSQHNCLGEFDHTFIKAGFVPKEEPLHTRGYYDEDYFSILCQSEFTLCPAGDAPWSMRFYEAILSKSIPILERHQHSGRNELEYALGYKFYTLDEGDFTYHSEWADYNFNKFIESQTLL